MGFFLSLILICLLVSFGVWFGVKSYAHFHQKFFLNHKEFVEGTVLYLALLLGVGAFSALSFIPASVVLLWGFAGLGILSFSQSSLSMKKRLFSQALLCFASVLALYQFSESFFYSLLLTFLWWGMWRLIVFFDRFPLTSFLVSLAWTMALLAMGLLIHTIPNGVVALVALLGVMTFLFSSLGALQKQPFLGQLISSMLGFIWAGVWVYFLRTGALFQTLTAFGYYLFEAGFLVMALFCQRPAQTLLSGALMNPQYAAKAAKSVFKHVLLLSFFAAVMMRTRYVAPLLIFALVVVLWDLYLRLNNLKNPLPTWRELLKNTRQGMTDFVVQMKQAASATQKHTVSKRKVVSSKKPKKAPLKKKPIQKRKKKK